MTAAPSDPPPSNPLGAFAGLVGVLAIFLFFTGWVYRWAYFGFFEIELNSLDFPPESFLLVPIQVVLGDGGKLGWAVLTSLGVIGLIKVTLWLCQSSPTVKSSLILASPIRPRSKLVRLAKKLHRLPLFQGLRWLTNWLPPMLRRDLIIVVWVLIALFWLAQWQGTEDAWRDVVNRTSKRPIVTLVSPDDKLALGAKLDDAMVANQNHNPVYPPLKNFRVFGDVEQFRSLYAKGINRSDSLPDSSPIVWRLLIENGKWLYVFPAFQSRVSHSRRPLVLAVNIGEGEDRVQLLILSRPKVNP